MTGEPFEQLDKALQSLATMGEVMQRKGGVVDALNCLRRAADDDQARSINSLRVILSEADVIATLVQEVKNGGDLVSKSELGQAIERTESAQSRQVQDVRRELAASSDGLQRRIADEANESSNMQANASRRTGELESALADSVERARQTMSLVEHASETLLKHANSFDALEAELASATLKQREELQRVELRAENDRLAMESAAEQDRQMVRELLDAISDKWYLFGLSKAARSLRTRLTAPRSSAEMATAEGPRSLPGEEERGRTRGSESSMDLSPEALPEKPHVRQKGQPQANHNTKGGAKSKSKGKGKSKSKK